MTKGSPNFVGYHKICSQILGVWKDPIFYLMEVCKLFSPAGYRQGRPKRGPRSIEKAAPSRGRNALRRAQRSHKICQGDEFLRSRQDPSGRVPLGAWRSDPFLELSEKR